VLSKTHLYWLLLILGILILFNLPVETAGRLKSAVRGIMAPYQALWAGGKGAGDGRKSVLPEGEQEFQSDNLLQSRMEALERENRSLRELLNLKSRLGTNTVACRVIARDGASGWWRTVRLDRGNRAGVRVGNPVLAAGGVAGVVWEVGAHTAEVLLLSDPAFHVSVRCLRNDALGIVQGGGAEAKKGLLEALWPMRPSELLYCNREAELREGDELATSGLGGVFPPGLPVGRIRRVGLAESGLYQAGIVEPFAPLDRLDFVLVLLTGGGEEEMPP